MKSFKNLKIFFLLLVISFNLIIAAESLGRFDGTKSQANTVKHSELFVFQTSATRTSACLLHTFNGLSDCDDLVLDHLLKLLRRCCEVSEVAYNRPIGFFSKFNFPQANGPPSF